MSKTKYYIDQNPDLEKRGIALLTVSWQSWKAATKNPVEALRYE